jgi:hypothetical protein
MVVSQISLLRFDLGVRKLVVCFAHIRVLSTVGGTFGGISTNATLKDEQS